MLQSSGLIPVAEELVYLSVVAIFMIFRITITMTSFKDPLLPLEQPAAKLLFGVGDKKKQASETTGKVENGKVETKKRR